MKVLFVSSGNRTSGVSNLILSQANTLIAQGINVDFYTIKEKGLLGYLQNVLPLRKQLKSNSYNLIHAHYGLCGLIALLGRIAGPKLIISFMGNDLLGDHARNGKNTLVGNLLVLINQFCARYFDYIIVKSDEMAHKISSDNIAVIPNGVSISQFIPMEKQAALNKIGWDPDFRHLFFLSDPYRPEKNLRLTENALRKLKTEKVLLHFLKDIPHDDSVLYYNASDVCILTSFHEGSPNVIKEAMACNRPVISTDVGNVKEVFGNIEGCYISSFDPSDVALKIKLALNFALNKGRTNGRNRIIEIGLDSVTIAQKLLAIYNKVLNPES
jgi:glycosyltransferase involved in cell wall biosynthesis